ncbi:Metal-dependent protein hydrolase [Babesia duncani]|uniref:Metal-dependent protein hydrolase n=1 Tax=Babesia duncani TaxID=323732 RepID=A0AAD9PKV9_9APIC|nr:Metal-dependent protein hydrolase [Babesia duncani]
MQFLKYSIHHFNYYIYGLSVISSVYSFRINPVVNSITRKHLNATRILMESPIKKQHCEKMKIGTHNGFFHCDEALAIYMLRLLPEYKDAEIVRTREQEKLDKCDVVVDVGGVFCPEKFRFDHHQNEFYEYFSKEHTITKLSSAGLVYRHFGKRIMEQVYNIKNEHDVEALYLHVYNELIEYVDAVDNGVPIADGKLRYKINSDISARVSRLNPSWTDPEGNFDYQFTKAVKLVGEEFDYYVHNYINTILPAKGIYLEAYKKRFELHQSGRAIQLPKSCPFSHFMYQHEEQDNISEKDKILFYVCLDTASNNWRATCTKVQREQFKTRLPFVERLRGLRDAELEAASGIPGLIFIHKAGFTCAGKTKVW